jgi:hypothetical protein
MSGIIIYIPPIIPTPPINPTSEFLPVNYGGNSFIDSNLKNVVNTYIQTENITSGQINGLKIDFVNNTASIGDPNGVNLTIDSVNDKIDIVGSVTTSIAVVPDTLLKITINNIPYYIQLNVPL